MVGGPNAFDRIERAWKAFCKKAEQCQSAPTFDEADYGDAISRLSRLRERYLIEKDHLTGPQAEALAKVFEEDVFIEGLMRGPRQISEHVQKGTSDQSFTVYTPANSPIDLDYETSAGAFFEKSFFVVPDSEGNQQRIDHLENLAEAERRIGRAMDNARPL